MRVKEKALSEELLVPTSVIDKIKAKIETLDFDWGDDLNPTARSVCMVCDTIDECIEDYLAESEDTDGNS